MQVAVYVAIWFSLPLVTLLLSARRPGLPQELLGRLGAWSRRHRRVITVVFLVSWADTWPCPASST